MRDLERAGPAEGEATPAGPLRQPDRAADPVSQWVRLGHIARKVVAKAQQRMEENAATFCHTRR